MMELARLVDYSTLSDDANVHFTEYTKGVERTIQDYCLSLEYMVGVLGKTNGKVIRVASALSLLETAIRMLGPEIPELFAIRNKCRGEEDSYLPLEAAETVKAQVHRIGSIGPLKISLANLERAINFVEVRGCDYLLLSQNLIYHSD
jgi:hypothetical protein